jgi:hypothetical protein
MRNLLSAAILFALALAPVHAQWLNYPSKNVPRTKDGKPDMSAPAPRTKDGKPDITGIWMPNGLKYLINIAADLKPDEVPFQPWAAALYKDRRANLGRDDPNNNCLPSGIPEKEAVTSPFKIMQFPGETLILYESRTIFREIFTDGRPLPKDPNPTWQGYSIGRWEGDDFVVDTIGLNDKIWMDTNGHPITEAAHITERFRRKDFGHMDIQITIDDPKAYTKPWTITENPSLLVDTDLLESVCEENNKDAQHIVGK